MDDEQMEVVEHLQYIGSLKPGNGNCRKDTISRIGMAKKIMLDHLVQARATVFGRGPHQYFDRMSGATRSESFTSTLITCYCMNT